VEPRVDHGLDQGLGQGAAALDLVGGGAQPGRQLAHGGEQAVPRVAGGGGIVAVDGRRHRDSGRGRGGRVWITPSRRQGVRRAPRRDGGIWHMLAAIGERAAR
jgi:hypothetical protein